MIIKRSLRPRGQRLTLMVLVVLVVVAGGLVAAQKWPGAWWWVPVAAASLAAVVAGAGPLWQRRREQQAVAAAKVRRSVRGTRGRAGDRLPTAAEVDLRMLRIHTAVIDVPYLHRTAKEEEVREQLCAGQSVLLVGSSMVGKTRLAAAVVKDLYPHRPILIPDTATALAALDEADMLPGDHVIWLDDLDRYLSGDDLTAGLVMRLAERNAVVATLRAREWDRFQPTDWLRPPEWDVLSVFEKVTLDRDRDRPNEEDLMRAVPDVEIRDRINRVGIGEYVGAAQHIADQLSLGAQSHPLGFALVRGAVDWQQTGLTRPVPARLLPALAAAHLTPRQRTALMDDEKYADALAWATREINPTVALLEPGEGVFTVYDYALDQLSAAKDAPCATTWQLVIDNAESGELFAIGFQAWVTYKLRDVAELSWRRAGDTGHIGAMTYLAVMLDGHGDLDEADTWYRRAADTGDPTPMCNLGGWLRAQGNIDEAETWYRRAAEAGDTRAMSNLGVLFEKRGDLDEAETWYRRAAEAGDTAP
jgi:tetratricopeptide (TPR) repeat protein